MKRRNTVWKHCTTGLLLCLVVGMLSASGCMDDFRSGSQKRTETVAAKELEPNENWSDISRSVLAGTTSVVQLSQTPIDDQQLQSIASARSVETLILDSGKISDASMTTIGSLISLTHLRVRESAITDAGIEKLVAGGLSRLRIFNLPQSSITAQGIRHLLRLPELRQLRLGGRQIDDHAMVEIAKLPKLESLHLIGPSLTDAALEMVAVMPEISSLYLDDCHLSDDAWRKLFAAKPNLHVHIDQQHHDRDPAKHGHK